MTQPDEPRDDSHSSVPVASNKPIATGALLYPWMSYVPSVSYEELRATKGLSQPSSVIQDVRQNTMPSSVTNSVNYGQSLLPLTTPAHNRHSVAYSPPHSRDSSASASSQNLMTEPHNYQHLSSRQPATLQPYTGHSTANNGMYDPLVEPVHFESGHKDHSNWKSNELLGIHAAPAKRHDRIEPDLNTLANGFNPSNFDPNLTLAGHQSSAIESQVGYDDFNSDFEASDDGNESMDEAQEQVIEQTMALSTVAASSAKRRARTPDDESDQPPNKRRKKGTGRRGGWSRGMKIGPRPAMEPSPEFTQLHQQALTAFIDDQDTEKARDLILQAIAINPEIYAAHALLSEIFFARDETDKAIAALFSGAHSAARDANVWRQVAEACLTHPTDDRQVALQQASYCYARIIHNDSQDYEARLDRAAISRELGNIGKANKDLDVVLLHMPRDPLVMRQIAEIGIQNKNIARAKSLYEETIDYYKTNGMHGAEDTFSWAHLNTYIQLLVSEELDDAARDNVITTLRQLSRWILGRVEEAFWDDYVDDDREWDGEDEPRRNLVPQHFPGEHPVESYGIGLPLEIRVKLGVLRLKQGGHFIDEAIAHFEWLEPEARDELATVYEFPDLFLEVAQALLSIQDYEQALRYFEALRDVGAYNDVDFWLGIATCYYFIGDKLQAIDCYEAAKLADDDCGEARTQLAKLYTDLDEKEKAMKNARDAVRIAEAATRITEKRKYERKENRLARKAAENALRQAARLNGPAPDGVPIERIEARLNRIRQPKERPRRGLKRASQRKAIATSDRAEPEGEAATSSVPRSKPKSLEEKDAYRTLNVVRLYDELVSNTEAMRSGDEEATQKWMECASNLLTDFRSNRRFFPNDRGYSTSDNTVETKSHKRGQGTYGIVRGEYQPRSLPESFTTQAYRTISFPAWLDVFLEHALLQAKFVSSTACYKTINWALDCEAWHWDSSAQLRIYISYFTCCLALRDDATLFNVVLRWFLRTYQFCTDAYRLFAAINLVFPHPMDKGGKDGQIANAPFRSGPSQKFMFRQIMMMDANLPLDYDGGGEWGPVPDFMRRQRDGVRIENQQKPTRSAGDGGGGGGNTTAGSDVDAEFELEPEVVSNSKSSEPRQDSTQPQSHSDVITPKEMDVVLLTLYAHILYAGGSFVNALSYFYRARSLDPNNPVLALSISLAYFHEMLKRQNENRHMYVLQGWAFFNEYVDVRRAAAREKDREHDERHERRELNAEAGSETHSRPGLGLQRTVELEIEFNRARIWHMLGMSDLAVRGYKRLLALASREEDFVSDDETVEASNKDIDVEPDREYSMEAAYAIQTMFALSGNMDMARDVAERYLVV